MNSGDVRQIFLDFFRSKLHEIVASAPMVVKDDPTLMFTNAGMNQFKDIFLGNSPLKFSRIANTQKCLRVSGKHNDLEEVGHDTYHHTMFEMLGNWSFGDYFKEEAIAWAWEFLTGVLNIDRNRLYVTIFEGDAADGIDRDSESFNCWLRQLGGDQERIINGNKKDNFWEMGDTGPCGPCSEIHVDIRDEADRKAINGRLLVNKGHPQVIEVWNLVFIQYNRKANGALVLLPNQHVDTGMGFERLCMVIQQKKSNYDTDIFQPIIKEIGRRCGIDYGHAPITDVAMRVVADHLRAVSFAIADGQLPSNNKAGYVIRRILRRAIRYNYTFLGHAEPAIFRLVKVLAENMGNAFPELVLQQSLIEKVIKEEELAFLRTLETGTRLLDQKIEVAIAAGTAIVEGKDAFELYDTFGFPIDLTELIAREKGLSVDRVTFESEMVRQKERSKSSATIETDDWVLVNTPVKGEGTFIGYFNTRDEVIITRYRKIKSKDGVQYQLVFNQTPFYAESGGQVGDKGYIEHAGERVEITNTTKENNLTIHLAKKLPAEPTARFKAYVNDSMRGSTARNHTATHLLHHALRTVLGTHVEQKGSHVAPDYLRFDFAHFQRLTVEELQHVESVVNEKIRENIGGVVSSMSYIDAMSNGAMALFGEKYGDEVRVVKFGDSVELCGGCHVKSTGELGYFRIISESAIAAGIRRIEAVTGKAAEIYIQELGNTVDLLASLMKTQPANIGKAIQALMADNQKLQKQVEGLRKEKVQKMLDQLLLKASVRGNIKVISDKLTVDSVDMLRDLAFQLKARESGLFLVLGAVVEGKPVISIAIGDDLVTGRKLHAGNIVKVAAMEIGGSGGGQSFFATAGGKDAAGLDRAIEKALGFLS